MQTIRRSVAVEGSRRAAGRRAAERAGRATTPGRVGAFAVVLGMAVLAASGCGAGTGAGEEVDAADGTSGPDLNPSGDEPGEVEPYVGELLAEYDQVVNEIVADPSVAEDDDAEVIGDFLALFEPDSEFATEMVELWAEMADEGRRTVPYSDDHLSTETGLDGPVTSVSSEEVRFPVCIVRRSRVLGPDDEELEGGLPRLDLPGEGVAVRTDDGWRLREVWAEPGGLTCREEG